MGEMWNCEIWQQHTHMRRKREERALKKFSSTKTLEISTCFEEFLARVRALYFFPNILQSLLWNKRFRSLTWRIHPILGRVSVMCFIRNGLNFTEISIWISLIPGNRNWCYLRVDFAQKVKYLSQKSDFVHIFQENSTISWKKENGFKNSFGWDITSFKLNVIY